MEAVIMAGGKGTRLHSVAADIPKPMVPILGRPVLEYQIESLKKSGIRDIILVIGHLGEQIKRYFTDGRQWGVHIDYLQEERPLGTAGSLFYLKDRIKDDFIVVFGDLLLDIEWNRFMGFHKTNKASLTLYGHPNAHPYDSDVIVADQNGKIVRIEPKNTKRDSYYHNFVNAGAYCISPKILSGICTPKKLDLEKNIIADNIGRGNIYAYRATEYIKDMGTPERLQIVTEDIRSGIVRAKNLKYKQKAIFLDRDGTINKWKNFLNSVEQFELFPNVANGIKRANRSKYITIVATNQPVIARGECTFEELDRIHMKMEMELGKKGAYLDDIFFCPHHPNKGFPGEIPELKRYCMCRKPGIGMLTKAAMKYNISLNDSWYIGDTTVDVQTGINAGMHTILLHTGEAGMDGRYEVKAEYEAQDLGDAIDYILEKGDGDGLYTEDSEVP